MRDLILLRVVAALRTTEHQYILTELEMDLDEVRFMSDKRLLDVYDQINGVL